MATVNGTAGNDTLSGTSGADTINGLGGNDLFLAGGNTGADLIDGGTGTDSIEFRERATSGIVVNFAAGTISGGGTGTISFTSIERVVAGNFNDSLSGNAAAQTLTAQAGADTLWGAGGADTLWGGTGADTFVFRETGTANADRISDWASGSDKIVLDASVMSALGANGNFAAGDARFWSSSSGAAHDADDRILFNTTTRQLFYDADGNGSGAAQLIATLQTGATLVATDIAVEGGSGGQTRSGTAGNDSLAGTEGNDTINGLAGDDRLDGLGGNDVLDGGTGSDTIFGGAGNDRINVFGGGSTGYGDDVVDGGDGIDTLDFSADARTAITVELWRNWITGGGEGGLGTVTASSVENVTTGAFADDLSGDDFANVLDGRGGNDTLWGAWGNDTLRGGDGDDSIGGSLGNDFLEGGAGADHFRFTGPGEDNADTLSGFATGVDKLHLDANYDMEALGVTGNFSAGDERFHAGVAAHDASDRVIWDGTTLWFDSDGTGSQAMLRIANFLAGSAVMATDIVVDDGAPPGTGVGGEGNDSLTGTSGNDTIQGLGGDDTINGLAGSDSLTGGQGGDVLNGGDGNDTLDGWYGEPTWWDNELVADTLSGGLGDDVFYVDHAADNLIDTGGIDTVHAADMDWTLGAGFENLVIHNDRSEAGGIGIGNELNNHIRSTYGPTRLEGRGGDDSLTSHPSWGGSDLLGGEGNDSLDGVGNLDGGSGNDTLLAVGGGISDLTGGADADSFIFRYPSGDRIWDFSSGTDRIRLDAREMSQLGMSGTLAAGDPRFYSAAGATAGHDADDRIIFDPLTGRLYFDRDGSGAEESQILGTLYNDGAPAALSATDITVDNGAVARTGTAGNDSLVGGSGNDAISGFGGNDTLVGLDGHDTLDGGAGTDTMRGGAQNDVYYATSGDVIVEDAPGWNGGIDTVVAEVSWTLNADLENLQLLEGAPGALNGTGNIGANQITGNSASNVLIGGGGGDTLLGGGGDDTITGGDNAWVRGEAGNDVLTGEELDGGDGNDRLTGTGYRLTGGAGNDTIESGAGSSHDIRGDAGADTFILAHAPTADLSNWDRYSDFTGGVDELRFDARAFTGIGASGDFSAGDERFHAAAGATTGHDATDRLVYNTSTGDLWYDPDGIGGLTSRMVGILRDTWFGAPAANLQATDIAVDNGSSSSGQVINGTASNDTLAGGAGNDTMNGLGGNDLFVAGANGGNDTIDGGTGTDSIEFRERATSAVIVDFGAGSITGGGSGTITFTGIERIVASNFNDTLNGTAGTQTLTGQSGADSLWGAAGTDTLWGGGGNDAFIFREMETANADRVSDFASGLDKLQLDDSAFTAIGAGGNFVSGDVRFWSAAGAMAGHDTNDRVIFNTSTGSLYYDADGSGAGAAQLIGTLQSGAALAATDITVI